MKQIYLYALVLILFTLQSCTFEPKGGNFKKVDPTGKTPTIQVNLNLAGDTLFISRLQTVTFAYGLNNNKINFAQFIINGGQANEIDIQPNTVSLTRFFDEAAGKTFSFEMKIFVKSQTGSIADKVGAEGFMISRKWTIVMVNLSDLAAVITKAEFVDGSLRIEWTRFKGQEFQYYKIYKLMANSQQYTTLLATINSRDQTSFVDNTYSGEDSYYFVNTNDNIPGSGLSVKGPLPILIAENTANGNILLKWSKPPYYNNLKGYRISLKDNMYNMQKVAEVSNVTTDSLIFPNSHFGNHYELYLTPLGKYDNYYSESNLIHYLSTSVIATNGLTIPSYGKALAGVEPTTYLWNTKDGILQFDSRSFTTTKRFKYNETILEFAVSANDKYLVSRVNMPQKIYLEDLTDPTKSKGIDLSVSLPQMETSTSISDAGTGIMMNYNNIAILYDYINERKLAEINLPGTWGHSNKISASGNFFYIQTSVSSEYYQFKNNQPVLLQVGTNQGNDLVLTAEYLPGNNEKLVRVYYNRIEVVDCNTWTIEKKWLFPNLLSGVYNLDKKSGKLLIYERPKLLLFDVINGTKEELTTLDDFSWGISTLFYNSGYLLWGEGKALKTN